MQVSLIMAISADGKITKGSDGLVDWTTKEDKQFFSTLTKEMGVLVYGKTTFDTFNKPLPGRLNIVMTRKPDTSKNMEGSLEFTNASPQEILDDLAARGFDRVALTGGGQINTLFLNEGLIDDIYLTIEPHLFGTGKPLFADLQTDVKLELLDVSKLNDSTLLVHYKIKY